MRRDTTNRKREGTGSNNIQEININVVAKYINIIAYHIVVLLLLHEVFVGDTLMCREIPVYGRLFAAGELIGL